MLRPDTTTYRDKSTHIGKPERYRVLHSEDKRNLEGDKEEIPFENKEFQLPLTS